MKLFLIKFGKVWSQAKDIGFFNTFLKIIRALKLMLMPVGAPGDVLFITNGTGDSARYRTTNVAEELELQGFKCSIATQDNFWLESYADKFKIFIFHRVVFSEKIANFIEKIKNCSGEIFFETDDLTFDPQYATKTDYYAKLNPLEKKQYESGLGLEILKDPYVKNCTTTTAYLAKILEGFGKKVFVIPNKLSENDLRIAEKLVKRFDLEKVKSVLEVEPQMSEKIRIGYFSGTKSHDRDFETVSAVLEELLKKHEKLRIVLAGPLELPENLKKYSKRVERLPYVSRIKHLENVASVDINIVPLEIGDPFCESKSELKFFEAGILSVPTVAAATQTFREAINDGEDGFTAANSEEWLQKLEKLIMDKKLRQEMGAKALDKALQKYTTINADNEAHYQYLKAKAGGF
jgi:O-antigen biosynthesis protein